MNAASILIVILVAAAFVMAVRYIIKHGDSCAQCASGQCSGECKSCSLYEQEMEEYKKHMKKIDVRPLKSQMSKTSSSQTES